MAKSKTVEIKWQDIDRLGSIQNKIEQAQKDFAASIADLVTEQDELAKKLKAYVMSQLGDLATAKLLTPEEADALTAKAERIATVGEVSKIVVTVRNNRVLDDEKTRKKIGQKKWNEISTVTLKDLGGVLGTDEIDQLVEGFKPSIGVAVKPIV